MTKIDGGPAFPATAYWSETDSGLQAGHTKPVLAFAHGMSLRDYFAAQALAYICHFNILETCMDKAACELMIANAANLSFSLADAMLKAREGVVWPADLRKPAEGTHEG